MSYKVKIRSFEGPFDLLVYLIENAEMSIYDIRISEITSDYIEYISTMKEMNVEVSSEFLVLAAELLNIKSRMMLPAPEPEEPGMIPEDPRSPLVERIVQYKLCKEQSNMLRMRQSLMENVFEKPKEDISVYTDNPDEYLSLEEKDFVNAFNKFLLRKQRIEETRRRYTRIERERETMESRMAFIRDTFVRALDSGDITEKSFRELIPMRTISVQDANVSGQAFQQVGGNSDAAQKSAGKDKAIKEAMRRARRYDTIVSFASLLQMMRDRYLTAEQKEIYGDIIVKPGEVDIREFDSGVAADEDKKLQESGYIDESGS